MKSAVRDPSERRGRASWRPPARSDRGPRTVSEAGVRLGDSIRRFLLHPVRSVPLAFLAVILLGAGMLMLPFSRTDQAADAVMPALFTAVSAVCVTGLATVDTPAFWTPAGHTVILILIQLGGFGVMTLASLLALMVRKTLGLRGQLVAQSETHTLNFGDVRHVLFRVARIMLVGEGAVALLLSGRFLLAYGQGPGEALWRGVFHAVSAFNNAGFALYSDNLMSFAQDPWILLPLCAAVVAGGLGFPVFIALGQERLAFRRWSVHLRLTVVGTVLLLVLGFLAVAAFEWNRAETLGPLPLGSKILGAVAGSVFPRTAGFNAIDYGVASPETLMVTNILMFIGGGSAGTAGGIKVTTFLVLGFAIWNEARGRDEVTIGHRTISAGVQRQALSVALLGVGAVTAGCLLLLMMTDFGLEKVLFESVSAFATVGLSTGITGKLPVDAQWVVMALMFLGRIGSMTVASALALSTRPRYYRLPEERPIIG